MNKNKKLIRELADDAKWFFGTLALFVMAWFLIATGGPR